LQAKYSIIHDASFTLSQSSTYAPSAINVVSTYNVEIQNRQWVFADALGGNTLSSNTAYGSANQSYSLAVPGGGKAVRVTQTVTYSDGQKATSSQVAIVDELNKHSFTWKYHEDDWTTGFRQFFNMNEKNNRTASFTWDLKFSTYYTYASKTIARGYDYSVLPQYITSTDATVKVLADFFQKQTSGWSDLQRANYVLKFVQSIPYAYDIDNYGQLEYFVYPVEILWKQKGDCEDHAFLYATLMKAMGYKVALVSVPGHLLAAVNLPDGAGSYYMLNGVKYYYCEATATNAANTTFNWANVGYIDPSYTVDGLYLV
jgi:predicted transglutaminase-like cysteine proteinase